MKTPQEINILIAEAIGELPAFAVWKAGNYYRPNSCGYTSSIFEAGRYTEAEAKAELVRDEHMKIVPFPPSDFYGSLDAMARAEATLRNNQFDAVNYPHELFKEVTGKEWDGDMGYFFPNVVFATSAQRAIAFCRAKGLAID